MPDADVICLDSSSDSEGDRPTGALARPAWAKGDVIEVIDSPVNCARDRPASASEPISSHPCTLGGRREASPTRPRSPLLSDSDRKNEEVRAFDVNKHNRPGRFGAALSDDDSDSDSELNVSFPSLRGLSSQRSSNYTTPRSTQIPNDERATVSNQREPQVRSYVAESRARNEGDADTTTSAAQILKDKQKTKVRSCSSICTTPLT